MTDITDDMLPEPPEELGAVRCMIRGEMDYSEAGDYYYTRQQMRDYARATLTASRAEVEGLKKDAERYRWLKVGGAPAVSYLEMCPSSASWDKAIDAAMENENV